VKNYYQGTSFLQTNSKSRQVLVLGLLRTKYEKNVVKVPKKLRLEINYSRLDKAKERDERQGLAS
jgi:hypothetical protein